MRAGETDSSVRVTVDEIASKLKFSLEKAEKQYLQLTHIQSNLI